MVHGTILYLKKVRCEMTKSAKEREVQHYQHPPQSLQQSQTQQNVTAITTKSEKR